MRPTQFLVNALCSFLPCSTFNSLQHVLAPNVHRVAVIGAGAAGSSAAFWIAKGKERINADIAIDIYDSSNYVGGRSTVVYPYDSRENNPAELGASIFVAVNKNMMRAAAEFNLTLLNFDDNDGLTGIWDGQQFIIKLGGTTWIGGWWNKLQVLWRYGYSAPSRTLQLVKSMTNSYLHLYSPEPPRWQNISECSFALGFTSYVAQTMSEYLDSQSIDRRWTREMVEAATRVNYGQNVDTIHALSGMASMAANGAKSVKGGNYQIFEHFISASGARLFLSTPVTKLEKQQSKWIVETEGGSTKTYESVILAAPYTSSLKIEPPLDPPIDHIEYVHLHVTLLTTTCPQPNATYFGHENNTPTTILTSFDGARAGGQEPIFNSISYHGRMREGVDEWVVKIFSHKRLSLKWLNKVFDGQVGWVYRKEWDAYPVMKPRTDYPLVTPVEGLYYVNAIEPFISTMDTETIAARNVVDLLFSDTFNSTICGGKTTSKPKEDFVYGWDC